MLVLAGGWVFVLGVFILVVVITVGYYVNSVDVSGV